MAILMRICAALGSACLRSLLAALALTATGLVTAPAHAERIKELASIRGVNSNALIGYGIVVGLAGTGDSQQSIQTQQMVSNLLSRRFGTVIKPSDVKAKNVAVVMVSARLPPFSRKGRRLDVTVSSASDAKSLYGGTLIPTALRGGNGKTYAWAEGPMTIGGFSAEGGNGSSVTRNHPTVGHVPGGAVVAKEIAFKLDANQPITVSLHRPDFTTAARTARAINDSLGGDIAHALDPGTVRIQIPKNARNNLVGVLAAIENIEVIPDQQAKIVVNERTGTIVMGTHVRISACAISHGSLTVQISEQSQVSQPSALSPGETVVVPDTEVTVTEEGGGLHVLDPGPTLGQVVYGLNALGVRPRDLVAILMAMKHAGALRAELEIQ